MIGQLGIDGVDGDGSDGGEDDDGETRGADRKKSTTADSQVHCHIVEFVTCVRIFSLLLKGGRNGGEEK